MDLATPPANALQIFDLIPKVMASVGEIGKDKKNTQQNYKFRGIDDALNFCGPAFSKHGVTPSVIVKDHKLEMSERGDKAAAVRVIITLTLRLTAPDGSCVENTTVGEGLDYGSDKATSKAMSAAMKYALFLGLVLPVEAQNVDGGIVDSDHYPKEEDPPKVAKPKPATKAASKPPATKPAVSTYEAVSAKVIQHAGNYAKLSEMHQWTLTGGGTMSPEEREKLAGAILFAIENCITNFSGSDTSLGAMANWMSGKDCMLDQQTKDHVIAKIVRARKALEGVAPKLVKGFKGGDVEVVGSGDQSGNPF